MSNQSSSLMTSLLYSYPAQTGSVVQQPVETGIGHLLLTQTSDAVMIIGEQFDNRQSALIDVTGSNLDSSDRTDWSRFYQQPIQTATNVSGSTLDQPSNTSINARLGFETQTTNRPGSSLDFPEGTQTRTGGVGHKIRNCRIGTTMNMKCLYCFRENGNFCECTVCNVTAICKPCVPIHMKETPKKTLKHKIQKIGLYESNPPGLPWKNTGGQKRQKTKDCWHCSNRDGKRRRSTWECVICDVGVCVDCRDMHCRT